MTDDEVADCAERRQSKTKEPLIAELTAGLSLPHDLVEKLQRQSLKEAERIQHQYKQLNIDDVRQLRPVGENDAYELPQVEDDSTDQSKADQDSRRSTEKSRDRKRRTEQSKHFEKCNEQIRKLLRAQPDIAPRVVTKKLGITKDHFDRARLDWRRNVLRDFHLFHVQYPARFLPL